jgi:N-acetylmuramoyl-L-alanine amidase
MKNLCKFALIFFSVICVSILANGIKVQAVENKLLPKMWIEDPQNNATLKGTSAQVRGWSLNASGVKQVVVYIDGKQIGNANIAQARPDVNHTYPGYTGGANSGFTYTLDLTNITVGQHTLKIKSLGNDGSSIEQDRKININKPIPRMWVETPQNNTSISGTSTKIVGWSLNGSGVKQVVIYVDGNKIGNASIGQARPDVNHTYPGYTGGANSGYTYNLDISKLTGGQHTLTVESLGNDGNSIKQDRKININKPSSKMWVETPQNNASLSGTSTNIIGWSLNGSGVKQVAIYVDGSKVGNANIGQARSDVNGVYPGYPGGANSGFTYNFDTSKLTVGQHTLTVESLGNDGSSLKQDRKINISKPVPRMWVETPQNNTTINGKSGQIIGWSLNSSGVKQVAIYVDGSKVGNADIGQARPDVNRAYPGYTGGANSGFTYTLDVSKFTPGQHTLTVESLGNDGSSLKQDRKVNINNKIIAIDIGHNVPPSDVGAEGILKEGPVNLAVGERVINQLKQLGYNVIATKPDTATNVNDSLQQRVDAANNAHADLFISIHANVAGGVGVGTEVWAGGSAKSIELGQNIEDNMVALGYKNRGVKIQGVDGDHLYVLNNTSMPAVLVETFFLDSQEDVNRYNPDDIANAIVKGIISSLD